MQIQAENLNTMTEGIPEAANTMRRALYPSLPAATVARASSSSSAAASLSSSAETAPHQVVPPQSIRCADISDSFEQNPHRIAHQVYSDHPLNEAQHLFLSKNKSNGTLKSELLYITSKILRKSCLTNNEKVTVELFLSNVVNNMDSFASSHLPASIIETLNRRPIENKGMEEESSTIFDQITKDLTNSEDLNLKDLSRDLMNL